MKNKKIIISNGFNNFPMRFIAEGLNKKGYDVIFLTGFYPYKKILTILSLFKLDKIELVQRFANRKIDFPENKIHSFFFAELIHFISANTFKKLRVFRMFWKFFDFKSAQFYHSKANAIINKLKNGENYVYLCRAGYGGISLLNKKIENTFVQHNNVHPKVMHTSIKKKGEINHKTKFKDRVDGLFLHIVKDMNSAKYIITSGKQAAYANKLFFKKHSKQNKKVLHVNDQVPSVYLKYLKKNKIKKNFKKRTMLKVCYLGSFTERKGGDVLIDVIKNFDPTKIELNIITNNFDLRYKEIINNYKNKKNLNFLVNFKLDKIIKKMLQTHVFMFPSYSEGLARSPIEALACGNYAILSKIFMKDYDIENLAISFLDQKQPKIWMKKLYKIRNELNIPNKIFRRNNQLVLKYFSHENFIKSYIEHLNI